MRFLKFTAHRVEPLALLALGLASAASFAGRWQMLFELASNFRVQLALASLGLLIVAALRRRALLGVAALALCAINFAPLLPYMTPAGAAAGHGTRLRLMTVNLQNWSTRSPAVLAMADDARADLIVFTEIAAVHREAFAALVRSHPFQAPQAARDGSAFDVRLASRWPIDSATVHLPEGPDFPVLEARICEPLWPRCLVVIALHAPRPLLDGRRERQLAFAAALARAGGKERDPVVVVGDLNVTPFSPLFSDLLAQGGLRDSMLGQGLQPSWLSRLAVLGLTLDHVLTGPGIAVIERKRGREFGSDHAPVIVDLRIP